VIEVLVILICRLELQKLLGHVVSDANLQRVASLAQKLFGLTPSDHGPPLVSEGLVNGSGNDLEFGADLVFQSPARFLVNVSLEDGELLGEESTAPSSSSHEGWYEPNETRHYPSAADGGNFNLSWLRDACDRIVRGSTSQLSRDELAMAICRVLDSDKPGEEVSLVILILVLLL
jgi:activating signal cointegrator complex subunit 3